MYTGYDYEEYCCGYLKKHGYKRVIQTPKSGDHGIDIIAVKHRKKYAFQCKYYENKIGNRAVQEAYTGCNFYDCDIPVVITNSTFTRNAIIEADTLGVELMEGIEIKRKPHYIMRLAVVVIIAAVILEYMPESISSKIDDTITVLLNNHYVIAAGLVLIACCVVYGIIKAMHILKKSSEAETDEEE